MKDHRIDRKNRTRAARNKENNTTPTTLVHAPDGSNGDAPAPSGGVHDLSSSSSPLPQKQQINSPMILQEGESILLVEDVDTDDIVVDDDSKSSSLDKSDGSPGDGGAARDGGDGNDGGVHMHSSSV